MLLIRRSVAVLLLIISAAAVFSVAISAYMLMTAPGQPDTESLRFQAEKILFAGIILTCITAAAFGIVLLRSRNIKKDLEKLIKQNRLNPASTKQGLLRLGETGSRLHELYRQIDEVSEKRGRKISALSQTAELLCQNIGEAILIIDVTGCVIHASRGWLESENTVRSAIVDKKHAMFSDGYEISTILSKLEKKHRPVETVKKGIRTRWVPIYNSENEISYVAVLRQPETGKV
ncbi:MAG: hypothetical protein PQJ61_05615 [Spirochaetales bacterium]|uniref:PAS domain-containing protein n=1 Tax=Candidatus Thalassospirochaeta sargassi TaxID=3119039 RepID=A0AAJ1IBJ3_9SPIO|nr:hypothetical protein [Spirochaetales bacterium]